MEGIADQKASAELQAERASIVKDMASPVYQRYERVRKARRGIAVADATDGRCSVCHMALRPQFFQELRNGKDVLACESCTRILFYNPPVSFEELTGEPAPAVRE